MSKKRRVGKKYRRKITVKHPPNTLSSTLLEWGGGALQGISNPDHAALVLSTLSCAGLLKVIPFSSGRRQAPLIVRHIVAALGEIGFEAHAVNVDIVARDGQGNVIGTLGSSIPAHIGDGVWTGYQVIYVPAMGVLFDPLIGIGDFHRSKHTRWPLLARIPVEPVHGYRFDMRAGDIRLEYRVTEHGDNVDESESTQSELALVDANLAVAVPHLQATYAALCADIEKRRT